VVEWLAPVALFWTMAALYLGGFPLTIEGGGGARQFLALLITFALYLAVWFGLRAVLRGPAGAIGGVAIACLVATVLLPLLARVGFRAFGVRIS
jgi:hypothetical protein